MATSEFPLKWPKGWVRQGGKEESAFKTTTLKAHKTLSTELQRMGGSNIIISTDVPLRVVGTMRMDRNPVDPGCAVYFTRAGRQMVFACDRYDDLKDNMQAIAKTVEAMRGIERWGASSMMERAFTGFGLVASAAPATLPSSEHWWSVLSVSQNSSIEVIEAAYRALAKKAHPDNGGSNIAMHRLTQAREQARQSKGAA